MSVARLDRGSISGVASRRLSAAALWLAGLLVGGAVAVELPPEIQVDRHLLEAEQSIKSKDFVAAMAALDQILELQHEHRLETPPEFWFRHAQVSHQAGQHRRTMELARRYLMVEGQDGEFYAEALELLVEAEDAPRRIAAEAQTETKAAETAATKAESEVQEARQAVEAALRKVAAARPDIYGFGFLADQASSAFRRGESVQDMYSFVEEQIQTCCLNPEDREPARRMIRAVREHFEADMRYKGASKTARAARKRVAELRGRSLLGDYYPNLEHRVEVLDKPLDKDPPALVFGDGDDHFLAVATSPPAGTLIDPGQSGHFGIGWHIESHHDAGMTAVDHCRRQGGGSDCSFNASGTSLQGGCVGLGIASWRDRDEDPERTYVVTSSSFRDLIARDLRTGCEREAFGGKHKDTVVEYACDIVHIQCSADVTPAASEP